MTTPDRYPGFHKRLSRLSPEERLEAVANLDRYVAWTARLIRRLAGKDAKTLDDSLPREQGKE